MERKTIIMIAMQISGIYVSLTSAVGFLFSILAYLVGKVYHIEGLEYAVNSINPFFSFLGIGIGLFLWVLGTSLFKVRGFNGLVKTVVGLLIVLKSLTGITENISMLLALRKMEIATMHQHRALVNIALLILGFILLGSLLSKPKSVAAPMASTGNPSCIE